MSNNLRPPRSCATRPRSLGSPVSCGYIKYNYKEGPRTFSPVDSPVHTAARLFWRVLDALDCRRASARSAGTRTVRHPERGSQVRSWLAGGGRWIRTFGSPFAKWWFPLSQSGTGL